MEPKQQAPLMVQGRHLLIALNWLKYLTTFEAQPNAWPPFFIRLPTSNPWGFPSDEVRVAELLGKTLDLPPEDPTDTIIGPYIGNMEDYYNDNWRRFHTFLEANTLTGLLDITIRIDPLLPEEGRYEFDPDLDSKPEPSNNDRFRAFLNRLSKGEITLADLTT